jgi:phytoene dehydrogenase-like protein
MRQVIVIGAGLTGLACAFRLKQAGIPVLLLEASDSPGGVIATFQENGFLFEAGPQCPRFPRALWDLVREFGLEGEFVQSHARARRYILKNRQLHRAPFSPLEFISTRLVGAASKYRILAEFLRRSRPPRDEESLAEFIRRKFDGDILDYLVDPFTRSDSGQTQFNYSEVFGAGMAAAISTYAYHPHSERDLGNVADVWITQMGWDVGTYMVKEFWPDLRRKHHENTPQN